MKVSAGSLAVFALTGTSLSAFVVWMITIPTDIVALLIVIFASVSLQSVVAIGIRVRSQRIEVGRGDIAGPPSTGAYQLPNL